MSARQQHSHYTKHDWLLYCIESAECLYCVSHAIEYADCCTGYTFTRSVIVRLTNEQRLPQVTLVDE
jgi:hypothetical protein